MEHGLDFSQQRILVADDTSMMRLMHKKYLVELGFKVENIFLAEDGLQAQTILKRLLGEDKKPALIISDWDMPNVTGIEFLKIVRSQAETKAIAFIIVTGHEKPEEYPLLVKAGVNGIIVKPFKAEVYNTKIVDIMAKVIMSM